MLFLRPLGHPERTIFIFPQTCRPMARCLHRNPRTPSLLLLLCAATLPFLLTPAAPAQTEPSPAFDAAALVRRAVNNHMAAEATHHPQRFVLHKKDEKRDYTQEVIETLQGDVAISMAANGAPLTPISRQFQIDRLNNLAAHPDLQEHRRKREQEDNARVDKLMHLLPDAFLYHYDSTVPCTVVVPPYVAIPGEPPPPPASTPATSAECYHLTFTPKPNWNPPDIEAKIMRGMAGEVWIEKSQERLTRLNARLMTDVDFGWGVIGRLDKGGTILLEQTETSPSDWELTRMNLNFAGKALMVRSFSYHITEELARYTPVPQGLDYRKAIQMLESEPPPAAK